jgi:hypothetical protein
VPKDRGVDRQGAWDAKMGSSPLRSGSSRAAAPAKLKTKSRPDPASSSTAGRPNRRCLLDRSAARHRPRRRHRRISEAFGLRPATRFHDRCASAGTAIRLIEYGAGARLTVC